MSRSICSAYDVMFCSAAAAYICVDASDDVSIPTSAGVTGSSSSAPPKKAIDERHESVACSSGGSEIVVTSARARAESLPITFCAFSSSSTFSNSFGFSTALRFSESLTSRPRNCDSGAESMSRSVPEISMEAGSWAAFLSLRHIAIVRVGAARGACHAKRRPPGK